MIKVYMVSYDVKVKPKPHYTGLIALKKSPGWLHLLESLWMVHTSETAESLRMHLGKQIYTNDHIFVNEVNQNFSGWLPERTWQWIYGHVPSLSRQRV